MAHKDRPLTIDEEATESTEASYGNRRPVSRSQEIVQLRKTIVERPDKGTRIDAGYIAPHFYDCFNYSLLTGSSGAVSVALGVASAHPREGKTVVACNLAVSLTAAYQKRTIIVDLNLRDPQIHRIFGIPPGPGLSEAIDGASVHIAATSVKGLHLLTAGASSGRLTVEQGFDKKNNGVWSPPVETSYQLAQIAAFRNVIYSLKEYYDFVIVDLPSLNDRDLPLLFTNQLDGVLFVVERGKTKQMDIDRSIQMLNEHKVLGFVFNRIDGGFRRNGKGK